ISLIGILVMIGRKWAVIQNGDFVAPEHFHPLVPDLQKIKKRALIQLKKYGHMSLVAILRFHIRSSNLVKNKYEEVKVKVKSRRKETAASMGKKEISKFLNAISDYKQKIREIKH